MTAQRISRRDFLRISAAGAALSVLTGCQNPRRWVTLEPFVSPPEQQLAGVPTWYASTCRQCPAGCGIVARIMNGRAVKIEGNPAHPLNRGKLCARGQAGLQVLYNPDRLQGPVRQEGRGSRQFQPLSWDDALLSLVSKLQAAGDKVVFWLGSTISGHLYDLFQRFASAINAPDPLVFDLYTAFNGYPTLIQANQGQLPAYELGQADVVFSFGADFLGAWLSSTRYGIEFGEFRNQSLGKRGYLVQFEPRMSATGAKADRWLPLRPGAEGLVAQAIARLIADQGAGPTDRVERARALAADVDVGSIAEASGISAEELGRLAQIFAQYDRPLAIPGVPLAGKDQAAGIIAAVQVLNLIAGVAGQPGGQELPPAAPGLLLKRPAISSMERVRQVIDQMAGGQVGALVVYGANPAYELPDQAGFAGALAKVPFVVSSTPIIDETAVLADLILPDRTYLESWGYTVVTPGFGEMIVSSQQPVVGPVFDNRSLADVLLAVSREIPLAAGGLPWADEVAFLKESLGQLAGSEDPERFQADFQQHGGWWQKTAPALEAPETSPEKARPLSPINFLGDEQEYPYYLHLFMPTLLSDGRGASQPWLQGSPDTNTTISWQTWVEISPVTAKRLGVKQGDIVRVTSPAGELEAPVYLYPALRPDTIAIPLGQGHTDFGRYAQNRGSNPIHLLDVEAGGAGWVTPRVRITPTGKRAALATFENQVGVTEGFINEAFPGR
ncbi:MAG: molybdopterin-dependent oxidoreductase [Anaerolineales bacterium]|nr:molybdopterin-dependent oxidoreductase [Anaerolineales bacterium]